MAKVGPVGGICHVRVAGRPFALKGDLEYSVQSVGKETEIGQDGEVHGFTTKGMAPYIKGKFTHVPDLSIADYESIQDETITAELATGTIVTIWGAFVEGEIVVKADKGEVDLKFVGNRGDEVKP